MSNIPADLRYTTSHEWVRQEPDGTIAVGITDVAQQQLGDIVYLELPTVGAMATAGDPIAVIESVKAASDIYCPVDGEVIAVNGELETGPERVNADAYEAWLFVVRPATGASLDRLLDAAGYAALVPADE